MHPILASHHSSAPPDRVWEFASDFARAAERITGITKVEMLTPGPVGVGTTFREWRGRHDAEMTIIAWSPPRSYTLSGTAMGTEFVSEVRCVAEGSGTRLEMEIQAHARTFVAKLLSPLLGVMTRMMVTSCSKDLADIAAAAEASGQR